MSFRIFVENLGAYNNGESTGRWFDLPVDMDEIFESIFSEDELDEYGQPKGDWAIHDYELPFRIDEYQSVEVLNEVVDYMYSSIDSSILKRIIVGDYDADDLVYLSSVFGLEDIMNDFVGLDFVISQLQRDIAEGNLLSIKNKLHDVENISCARDQYFIVQGCGNFRSVTSKDIEEAKDTLFEQLLFDFTPNNIF